MAKIRAGRKLVRKNLVVEGDKISELARLKGTSESEAVREAVDFALAAAEVAAAIRELHVRGGIDDVFGKLRDEGESLPDAASVAWDRKLDDSFGKLPDEVESGGAG